MACYQGKERQFSQFFFAILITGQSVELIAQSHSGRDTGHDIEGIILIYIWNIFLCNFSKPRRNDVSIPT